MLPSQLRRSSPFPSKRNKNKAKLPANQKNLKLTMLSNQTRLFGEIKMGIKNYKLNKN
jgi:hypothetical protein